MAWGEEMVREKRTSSGAMERKYELKPDGNDHTLVDTIWDSVDEAHFLDNADTSGVAQAFWDGSDVKITGATASGTSYLIVRGLYAIS